MIELFFSGLNVLAFAIPIAALVGIINESDISQPWRAVAGVTAMLALYGAMYFAYPFIHFPAWMRWLYL